MLDGIKKYGKVLLMSFLVLTVSTVVTDTVKASMDDTNRNEQFPTSEYNLQVSGVSTADGYTKIYENKNFEYFFNTSKSVLKFRNKQSGFVWSTGAGNYTKEDVADKCSRVKANTSEYYSCAIDAGPGREGQSGFSPNAYAEINQMIGFSYYNKTAGATQTRYNHEVIGDDLVYAQFVGHEKYANRWMYRVSYETSIDRKKKTININMRLMFDETGFSVDILKEDITGTGAYAIEAIYPLPCFGQSGGNMLTCKLIDVDAEGYGACQFDATSITKNPKTDLPGYVFVPDGSGALIRFDTNREMENDELYFDVYGDPYREKHTQTEFEVFQQVYEHEFVKTKKVMMPVWGVSFGQEEDAFVAYATSGAEYFGLVFRGRSEKQSRFAYTQTKPRFERNRTYMYDFGSSSGTKLYLDEDEIYKYDMGLRYDILQGDGSDGTLPANYVGMALSYRNYLEQNALVPQDVELTNGVKVDFIVSDVKSSIIGYEDVIASTTDGIKNIYNELNSDGIEYLTSSLLGWQNNGISMAHPGENDYNSGAGGERGFKEVVKTANSLGYDINLQQDYGLINSDQMPNIGGYAVKALSRNYGTYILADVNKPVRWWHYTNPNMAMTWLNDQAKEAKKLGNVGITMQGVSNILAPDYGERINYEDSKNIIINGTTKAARTTKLGADQPNSYLWKNLTDMYDIPVYNSQYIAETDSVPFLEIVLGGLVNMYASYSNFSFFDDEAKLKMIEYNLNPSFILTEESCEDLMYTNSRDYYSTGYSKYRPIIKDVYDYVTPFLAAVKGKTIIDREVVAVNGETLGLYVNTYANYENGTIVDNSSVRIAINYLDYAVTYNGHTIEPMSAKII